MAAWTAAAGARRSAIGVRDVRLGLRGPPGTTASSSGHQDRRGDADAVVAGRPGATGATASPPSAVVRWPWTARAGDARGGSLRGTTEVRRRGRLSSPSTRSSAPTAGGCARREDSRDAHRGRVLDLVEARRAVDRRIPVRRLPRARRLRTGPRTRVDPRPGLGSRRRRTALRCLMATSALIVPVSRDPLSMFLNLTRNRAENCAFVKRKDAGVALDVGPSRSAKTRSAGQELLRANPFLNLSGPSSERVGAPRGARTPAESAEGTAHGAPRALRAAARPSRGGPEGEGKGVPRLGRLRGSAPRSSSAGVTHSSLGGRGHPRRTAATPWA